MRSWAAWPSDRRRAVAALPSGVRGRVPDRVQLSRIGRQISPRCRRGAIRPAGVSYSFPHFLGRFRRDEFGHYVSCGGGPRFRRLPPAFCRMAGHAGGGRISHCPRPDQLPRGGRVGEGQYGCLPPSRFRASCLSLRSAATRSELANGDPSRLLEIHTGDQSLLLSITAATSLAFFAMVGFEDSVNMVEECEGGARIFPRSIAFRTGRCGRALRAGRSHRFAAGSRRDAFGREVTMRC